MAGVGDERIGLDPPPADELVPSNDLVVGNPDDRTENADAQMAGPSAADDLHSALGGDQLRRIDAHDKTQPHHLAA